MSDADEVTPQPAPTERDWTRLEDYLDLGRLWRRSAERHRRRLKPRTEPSEPRLLSLGTLPFLLLFAAMAVLVVLIFLTAIPGRRAPDRPPPPPEVGTAPREWFTG